MHATKEKLITFLATGGFIGFAPVAPGTFGSIVALPVCWLLCKMPVEVALVILTFFICLSVWIAHAAERIEAEKDPKQVVVDEICGMAVTLIALPFTPIVVICGFVLFRLFDITKPFPIRWVEERFKGGFGIVLDDIVAGVFAHLILRIGLVLT